MLSKFSHRWSKTCETVGWVVLRSCNERRNWSSRYRCCVAVKRVRYGERFIPTTCIRSMDTEIHEIVYVRVYNKDWVRNFLLGYLRSIIIFKSDKYLSFIVYPRWNLRYVREFNCMRVIESITPSSYQSRTKKFRI